MLNFRSVLFLLLALHWRHVDHDGVSNHQPHDCLLYRLFRRRSKKTSKPRVTGLCAGNSPGPVNSPHKRPVTRKMFPFDDVIMSSTIRSSTNTPMTRSKSYMSEYKEFFLSLTLLFTVLRLRTQCIACMCYICCFLLPMMYLSCTHMYIIGLWLTFSPPCFILYPQLMVNGGHAMWPVKIRSGK